MMRSTALAGELLFQRFEPGNEHAVADLRGHRLFAARSHVEISPPFREGAVPDLWSASAERSRTSLHNVDVAATKTRPIW